MGISNELIKIKLEKLQSNLISHYNDYDTIMMCNENIVSQAMKMHTWYMLDEIILFKYLKSITCNNNL